MTTPYPQAALIKILEGLSDRAYCDYIAKMRTNECLGWEEKVRTSKFGQAELNAHTKAGELLGRHRAFAEAAAAASAGTSGRRGQTMTKHDKYTNARQPDAKNRATGTLELSCGEAVNSNDVLGGYARNCNEQRKRTRS